MGQLILFARRPLEGRVKTRLVPPLSSRQALALYRAFLADQSAWLEPFRARHRVEICFDGPWPHTTALPQTEQGPGDLGERLQRAFERGWREGQAPTVIVGADSPTLPATHVDQAFGRLEAGIPAVVAPAGDGGYVLLGMRRPLPELLRAIPWGGAEVLRTTLERAAAAGLHLEQLEPWYDVDDESGLRALRRELEQEEAARRAPASARCLASIDAERSRR